MTLAAGTRLGAYEVTAQIGAGGMGEVYRARDTRLDRTVAIKILPTELASDLDLRARFEREARAIAALDHPHICAVHDVGECDGTRYLVMQYLDGDTLAARLARTKGPLPLDAALKQNQLGEMIREASMCQTTLFPMATRTGNDSRIAMAPHVLAGCRRRRVT
jgi:serine/threonine-protein kinase